MVSTSASAEDRGKDALRGPHFVVANVTSVAVRDDGSLIIDLDDGSRWTMDAGNKMFGATQSAAAFATRKTIPVLVSGDRLSGRLESLFMTRRLAPRSMTEDVIDGELRVSFSMAMTIYRLRADRPWFASARRLIQEELRRPISATTPAELLLVSLDVVTQEIIDVRR